MAVVDRERWKAFRAGGTRTQATHGKDRVANSLRIFLSPLVRRLKRRVSNNFETQCQKAKQTIVCHLPRSWNTYLLLSFNSNHIYTSKSFQASSQIPVKFIQYGSNIHTYLFCCVTI